jgi:hypothetical protein
MGFSFKKFGQKAVSVARFGSKAVQAVGFGAKRVGSFMSRVAKPVSDLATVGASVAMALGQPEIAAPLVGLSKGVQRMGEAGRKINKTVNKVENVVGDIIEKPSVARRRQQQLASGPAFESGPPAVSSRTVSSPPRQPAVKFESSASSPAPSPSPEPYTVQTSNRSKARRG